MTRALTSEKDFDPSPQGVDWFNVAGCRGKSGYVGVEPGIYDSQLTQFIPQANKLLIRILTGANWVECGIQDVRGQCETEAKLVRMIPENWEFRRKEPKNEGLP
jgi:hypothetical protein